MIINNKLWKSDRKLTKKLVASIKLFFIYLVSWKQKKQINTIDLNRYNTLLIRTYNAFGDAIITTPVIREIKLKYPHIQIDVIASNKNQDFFKKNKYINTVYTLSHKPSIKEILNILSLCRNRYPIFIDLWGKISFIQLLTFRLFNSEIYLAVSPEESFREKYFIGTEDLRMYDIVFGKDLKIHQRDRMLDLLNICSIIPVTKEYDIFYSNQDKMKATSFVKQYGSSKLIGFSYHGSRDENTLSKIDATNIIKNILLKNNEIVIILFYEEDYFNEATEIIQAVNNQNCILSYKTNSFFEFTALVDKCDTIISVGTATLHIASTFNKNIIAIYPNTQYYRNFDPFSKRKTSLVFVKDIKNISYEQYLKISNNIE